MIVSEKVKIIISDYLLAEIKMVTSKNKLKKYFDPDIVSELLSLLDIIGERVKPREIKKVCRDPKDDFLLALSKQGKANYLITGDKDLLELKLFSQTKILTPKQFKEKIASL
ncbi:MAG: putative toxin-antitoxin system toxin component, PIN family [Bacteroidota bacterium]